MYSSARFTDLDGKQDSNLGLKQNDAKVNKLSKSAATVLPSFRESNSGIEPAELGTS